MSCAVVPTTGPILIVPLTMVTRWQTLKDCVEELNTDNVPIPLTGEEAQVWLDLDQRMESRYTTVIDLVPVNLNRGRRAPFPLPHEQVRRVVDYMNPTTEEWRVHYVLPRGSPRSEYQALGEVLGTRLIHTEGPYATYMSTPDAVLRGLLYCDWMLNDLFPLCWSDVDWQAITRLDLHVPMYLALRPDAEDDGYRAIFWALAHSPIPPDTDFYPMTHEDIDLLMGRERWLYVEFWERIVSWLDCLDPVFDYEEIGVLMSVTGLNNVLQLEGKWPSKNKLQRVTRRLITGQTPLSTRGHRLVQQALLIVQDTVQKKIDRMKR